MLIAGAALCLGGLIGHWLGPDSSTESKDADSCLYEAKPYSVGAVADIGGYKMVCETANGNEHWTQVSEPEVKVSKKTTPPKKRGFKQEPIDVSPAFKTIAPS